jgi:hypothetical protein
MPKRCDCGCYGCQYGIRHCHEYTCAYPATESRWKKKEKEEEKKENP